MSLFINAKLDSEGLDNSQAFIKVEEQNVKKTRNSKPLRVSAKCELKNINGKSSKVLNNNMNLRNSIKRSHDIRNSFILQNRERTFGEDITNVSYEDSNYIDILATNVNNSGFNDSVNFSISDISKSDKLITSTPIVVVNRIKSNNIHCSDNTNQPYVCNLRSFTKLISPVHNEQQKVLSSNIKNSELSGEKVNKSSRRKPKPLMTPENVEYVRKLRKNHKRDDAVCKKIDEIPLERNQSNLDDNDTSINLFKWESMLEEEPQLKVEHKPRLTYERRLTLKRQSRTEESDKCSYLKLQEDLSPIKLKKTSKVDLSPIKLKKTSKVTTNKLKKTTSSKQKKQMKIGNTKERKELMKAAQHLDDIFDNYSLVVE